MVVRLHAILLLILFPDFACCDELAEKFRQAQENTRSLISSLDDRWVSFRTMLHYPEGNTTTHHAVGISYSRGRDTYAAFRRESDPKSRGSILELLVLDQRIFHLDRSDTKRRVNTIQADHEHGEKYLNDATAFARPQDLFESRVARFVLGEFAVPKLADNGDLIVTFNPWRTFTSARTFEGVARKFFETTFDRSSLLPRHVVMFGDLDGKIQRLGDVFLEYDESGSQPSIVQVHSTGRANTESDPIEVLVMKASPVTAPPWQAVPFQFQQPADCELFDIALGMEVDPATYKAVIINDAVSNDKRFDQMSAAIRTVSSSVTFITMQESRAPPDGAATAAFERDLLLWVAMFLTAIVVIAWARIWRRAKRHQV